MQGYRCQVRTGHRIGWPCPCVPMSWGAQDPGDHSWGGDALPKAQHSPGRRDGAASPPVPRQFYKKWHFD